MPKPPKGGNVATIVDATKALASVCDGAVSRDQQGFNGSDSKFARSILSQAYLTQKQLAALHRMLAKYAGQLARMGFIYSELVIPAPGLVPGAAQSTFGPETYREVKPIALPAKQSQTETNLKPIQEKPPLQPWPFSDDELLAHFPKPWTPRPKQVEAIRAINRHLQAGKRFIVLEAGTGTGKTHIGMTVANAVRDRGGTHMLTANKQLQGQYLRDYPQPVIEVLKGRANYACTHAEADPNADAAHGVCSKQKRGILEECVDADDLPTPGGSALARAVRLELEPGCHRCPYWQNLQRCHDSAVTLFNFSSFLFQTRIGRFGRRAVMLVDECFAGETMILGPEGSKRIDSLHIGDSVLNAIGIGIVEGVSVKNSDDLFEVGFDNGKKLIATGSHPIFTERGWTRIEDLEPDRVTFSPEGVRLLRKRISSAQVPYELRPQDRSAEGCLATPNMLLSILLEEAEKPYAQSVLTLKDGLHTEKDRPQTEPALGQRPPLNAFTTCVAENTRPGVALRVRHSNEDTAWKWFSDMLQTRSRRTETKDRNRGGRVQSWVHSKKENGQEEDGLSFFHRVVSVSRIEPKSAKTVYNLRVSGHPSYFAEGNLVHNCHNIEPQLMSFVSLELTEWALSIVGVLIERPIATRAEFVEWLRETDLIRKIDDALADAKEGSEDVPEDFSQAEADALKELQGKLANFMAFLERTEWILDVIEYKNRRGDLAKKISARPLYAKDFAEDLLFRHAERVVGMSATILDIDVWCRNLGIDRPEVGFVQVDCDFPVENRPVFLAYAGNCGRKTLEQTKPKLVEAVRNILKRHEGQRGIIHTQSFDLSNLMRRDVGSPRFLFQDDFRGDKDAMLAEHARRTDSVIVAPAMAEGVDLKDELGRFQIILKVPYPSLGDKVIAERMRLDEKYFAWLTALKFVQSLGRIVRSSEDFGYSYVLDAGLEGFMARNGSMIPEWVRVAFKRYHPKEIRHG